MASANSNKGKAPTPSASGSVEAQLREEIKQLTSALDETDQALDEWMAECERLQKVIKAKENETKTLGEQMEELKQLAFKLEEEKNQLRASGGSGKKQAGAANAGASTGKINAEIEELRRANESLKAQLAQSQQWVKEGLAKLEEANALVRKEQQNTEAIEKERQLLMQGQKATIEVERDKALLEIKRLSDVVHAHELELTSLRSKLKTAQQELKEVSAAHGKAQALCTVARFQADSASTENDALVHWLKRIVRWSSKL